MDVSHAMYIGKRTSLNINPRHLVLETNGVNQTRKFCFSYMEEMLWRWEVGLLGPPHWGNEDFRRYVASSNMPCAILRRHKTCDCCVELWEELDCDEG
ncbi:hypothetical protein VTN96DRAFT_6608 [Rasamsonia emersonii]